MRWETCLVSNERHLQNHVIDDDLREPANLQAWYEDHRFHRPSREKQSLYIFKPPVSSKDDSQRFAVRNLWRDIEAIIELCSRLKATGDRVVLLRRIGGLIDLSLLYVLSKHQIELT